MIKKQLETEKDLNVTQEVRELAARHASARLLEAARQTPQEVFAAYETTPQGQPRPDIMRALFGRNELARKKADSILKRLFKAFINPFTVVLIVLAVISFITDYVIVEPEDRDLTAVLIVGIMVFISGTLRFVQEVRSGNAAERLQAMVKTTIAVLRDGESRERPISELVVGDVIRLAAGDMIPADVRIVETKDLFVSQSSLTGESEPMEKWTAAQPQTGGNPLECNNLAFMGSTVVSGSALALVIAVGKDTLFGALARRVAETRVRTNFEKGVNAVSWVLIRFMVGMVPVVLFLNGFTKGDWVQAGDTLVVINSPTIEAKYRQVNALEQVAQEQNKKIDAGTRRQIIATAGQLWNKTKSDLTLAQTTYQRILALYKDSVVTSQRKDEVEAMYRAAQAAERAAYEQYQMAVDGAQSEDRASARSMVDAARSTVDEVSALLVDSRLTAPEDGQIATIFPKRGELVAPGTPIMNLVVMNDAHVVLNIREDLMPQFKMDGTFRAEVPAIGKKDVEFRIYYISPLGSFATWKSTKQTGSYDMQTFEIHARPTQKVEGLRPGMSVLLTIDD